MPRDLSPTAISALTGPQTREVFLCLATLDHDDLDDSIRLVNDAVNVTSRGKVYTACDFDLRLPTESGDRLPSTTARIANVDRALTAALRGLTTPGTITLEVILASAPDTVEAGPYRFRTESIEFDVDLITFRLAFEDFLNEVFPKDSITPTDFPGIFG